MSDEIRLELDLPTDSDGFLRRHCPSCGRQFKWFSGATAERPEDAVDPDEYSCPYCGTTGDDWLTDEQLEYAQRSTSSMFSKVVEDEISSWPKIDTDLVKVSVEYSGDSTPPTSLDEPNDMIIVASPCHPWEPIKVSEAWDGPVNCLVCGSPFEL
jgi:hypothetical protein